MTTTVVFASNNSGKILELQPLQKQFNINIVPQAVLGVNNTPETGMTFIENALIKARHACQITGLPSIADDSGLQVGALNGAPGIYSARYAGDNATSQNNIKKLLNELINVPPEKRQARFYCVLIYMANATDATPLICEGIWDGLILQEPKGNNGFGYDSIFWDPIKNISAAELARETKNKYSHRGYALKLLIDKLQNILPRV
ncbi:MAG: non-canonical purine pyrophosphatase, RdgB/HAM1 family [Gammaproteobacteria bacterium]|jgi:XTP/dITP diphosphohydrolase|nr:non-canonical purine pyrophosphatase, RdgB/HAM1 family [Gammaproteobacteria bacterium]